MSSTCPAHNRISQRRILAIVVSDTDLDHAIMEICLRVPGATNRLPITLSLLPANGHVRISVFT